MKKLLIFTVSIIMSLPLMADNAKFSVLTCAPSSEAYALFGHTGLRYQNPSKGVDVVFNYGYFDFDSPNFVWRFIIGETDYMVGAVSFDTFCKDYQQRGSEVVEQVLDLTPEQERELYRMLMENCLVRNRTYRYNYFYNNCTTKIRDKVASVADGITLDATAKYPTFRDALNALLVNHEWYAFGINLLLGADIDSPATVEDLQFLPQNFMNDLDACYIVNADGEKRSLVTEKGVAVPVDADVAAVTVSGHSNMTPFNVMLLLLVATFIVMSCEVRKKKTFWGFDVLLMTLQGLGGSLLLFMALFSQHPAVDNNWLLLFLNPLALVLMPVYVYRIRKHKSMKIAWIQVAMVALFFVSAILQLQVYPLPIYFCAAALLVRSLFLIYKENICELSRF